MPSRYDKYATHQTSRRTDEWDYTQPAVYFVTLCTRDRACLFGAVNRGRMSLNPLGQIVVEEWRGSEAIRDRVHLDAFVVMPNHLHGIVVFAESEVEAPTCPRGYYLFGGEGSAEQSQKSSADDEPQGGADGGPVYSDDEGAPHGEAGGSNSTISKQASHSSATLGNPESDDGDDELRRPPRSLGSFVAGFKSAATKRINEHRETPGSAVWQRNYHDVIIRNERHWRKAREYIRRNPEKWGHDRLHRTSDA